MERLEDIENPGKKSKAAAKKPEPAETEEPIIDDATVKQLVQAIIKRISGDDGNEKRKWDYLTKPDNENIKTMSVLSEGQLDSTAECCFLGDSFPSLQPLKGFVVGLAGWSPSKQGKRAEQVTAAMINQETHLLPTMVAQPQQNNNKKTKQEEVKK